MRNLMVVVVIGATACGTSSPSYKRVGQIVLSQNGTSSGASAIFTDDDSAFGTRMGEAGSCTAYSGNATNTFSAGTIQITGASSSVTLTPSGTAPDVMYQVGSVPDQLLTPGATVTATAAGSSAMGDLPGFSLSTSAPQPISGESFPSAVSRSSGATVSWTPLPGARIWVLVAGFDPNSSSVGTTILCDVTDTGSLDLSPSTVALIPASDTQALMVIARVSDSSNVVTDTRVELDAVSVTFAGPVPVGS